MKGNQVSDDSNVPRQKEEETLEDPAVERYPRNTRRRITRQENERNVNRDK